MTSTQNQTDIDALRTHFGRELRRPREHAGLSMNRLAEALGCTPQWIHQLEKTDKAVPEQMSVDLDTYFKTDGWEDDDGLFHRIHDALRSIMDPNESVHVQDARVTGRLERQLILTREQLPTAMFVLDESVFRRPVGGTKVMVDQIDHLIGLARTPHLQVRVMPFERVTSVALGGGFILLSFEKDADLMYIESGRVGQLIDDRNTIFKAEPVVSASRSLRWAGSPGVQEVGRPERVQRSAGV